MEPIEKPSENPNRALTQNLHHPCHTRIWVVVKIMVPFWVP